GFDVRGRIDQSGYRSRCWNDAAFAWPHHVWIGGDETRPGHDEANGAGDARKAIRRCFTEDHIFWLLIGQDVADIVQGRCQARLADGEGAAARSLRVEELRGCQRGRKNRFWWHIQPHMMESHLQ